MFHRKFLTGCMVFSILVKLGGWGGGVIGVMIEPLRRCGNMVQLAWALYPAHLIKLMRNILRFNVRFNSSGLWDLIWHSCLPCYLYIVCIRLLNSRQNTSPALEFQINGSRTLWQTFLDSSRCHGPFLPFISWVQHSGRKENPVWHGTWWTAFLIFFIWVDLIGWHVSGKYYFW